MRGADYTFTDAESEAMRDLARDVESGEYKSDRMVLEITTGFVDGEPIVRGYGIDDAISYAEACLRRDREARA